MGPAIRQPNKPGLLTLTIKDKSALYLAYMPFVKNGGLFIPTSSNYRLGDEVFMLLNTVGDVAVTGDEEFRYSFLNNGNANAAATYEVPSALGTLRNGLPPGRMLRREFRALVSLRDYNY